MSDPFVGEIRMFAGNFAPRGWAFCDGQLLAISQNDTLFSLLGTIYGGDGRISFGLPDMRGRLPLHAGSGPGLTSRRLGSKGGAENVTLTLGELGSHSHSLYASTADATSQTPQGHVMAAGIGVDYLAAAGPGAAMADAMIGAAGPDTPRSHSNLMPALCINFIIALAGIYPSRH